MANLILPPDLSVADQLKRMAESAKDDLSDDEAESRSHFETEEIAGIRAPAAPPKVPKIFLSNLCVNDCQYCCMRASRESRHKYVHEPSELARLAAAAARDNGHGIFISSAVWRSSDQTEERIVETLRVLREDLHYPGYVHAKIMPGADPKLIEAAGWLADRLSVNIELPRSEGYATIARQKTRDNILGPMNDIAERVAGYRGRSGRNGRRFARSGQTTQIMVGAMREDDRTQVVLAEAMYRKYDLRRVYYAGFGPVQECDCLPSERTPAWRTRRLYQADRLLALYGFRADEVTPAADPSLAEDIDPKAAWALRHLDLYPLEINRASYEELIRIPGIGITSARKIQEARKARTLTFDLLAKMGVPLKRGRYFMTCDGKYQGGNALDGPGLRALVSDVTPGTPRDDACRASFRI
jgi:putative DNA modification/repair radical SAM protein